MIAAVSLSRTLMACLDQPLVRDAVTSPDRGLPAWARWLDWLILILLFVALLAELSGGISWRGFGFRISIPTPVRPLTFAAAAICFRHAFRRHASTLEHLAHRGWIVRDSPRLAPRPRVLEVVGATGFFTMLLALALHRQALFPFGVPDYGDPLFSTWRLAWVSRTIFRNPLGLFDANIFYPEPNTLALSDSVIVPSLVAAPLFWMGIPRLLVYQVVFASAIVSSGITLFVFVRRLTGSRAAALVSGSIFVLYPFRFEHYSHLELQMTMWMPIGLMLLHQLVSRGRVQTGAALGMIVGIQTLSSLYFGLYFAVYLGFVFGGLAIVMSVRPWRLWLPCLLAAAIVAALVAAPLVSPYLSNRSRIGERGPRENREFSAKASDYLATHRTSAMYGSILENGPAERSLFPGITPVALSVLAFAPPLTTVSITYGTVLLASFDASLGFNRSVYPVLYHLLLPFRGLRVPARFSMLVGLSLAILAGLGVARLMRRLSREGGALLAAALIGLVVLEYRPVLTLHPVWRDMPPVYDALIGTREAVVAVFPMSAELTDNDAKYMYFSTWHWQRLVNGYSGNFPRSYAQLTAWMRRFPSPEAIDYLKRRGVQYLVLHGDFMQPELYDRAIGALDANRRLELVQEFAGRPRPSRLYRLEH